MMNVRIFSLLLGLFWALNAGAQVFPIQLQQQLISMPQRVTDFSADPLGQYQVSVQLLDPQELSVQVQLRLRIEGPNLRIVSRAGAPPTIHQVAFGTPTVLSGSDLTNLFAPANLDIQGVDVQEFWRKGGQFPEGFYNVCVEAFLPSRPDQLGVSGESCVPLFVNVSEPPLLTFPLANQTLPALTPQNFSITWQDQGIGGLTNYDLEVTPYGSIPGLLQLNASPSLPISNDGFGSIRQNLAPIRPGANGSFFPGGNGQLGLGTVTGTAAPLLFRSGLRGLSYQLQPDDPILVPGTQYVVRVRAYDPLGERRFRNGGWSQPVVFTYGESCPAPLATTATTLSDSQVRLTWADAGAAPLGYTVRFRLATAAQGSWTTLSVNTPFVLLDQLPAHSLYEYEVRANCGGQPGTPAFGTFTTPGTPNLAGSGDASSPATPTTTPFVAGEGGEAYQPVIASCSPNATLAALATGPVDAGKPVLAQQTFRFYGMDVRPVTVSGGTIYQGTGTLLIPWLEQGAVAVRFADIRLNANGEAVQGTVTTIRSADNAAQVDLSKFKATLAGQESCSNYTETVLDARGFDDAGIHYLTGTELDPYGFDQAGNYQGQAGERYDPRGFDAEGTHTNGTPYNDNGCNRDSLNQYGQPCIWRQYGGAASENNSTAGDAPAPAAGPGVPATTPTAVLLEDGEVAPGPATVAGTAYLGTISEDSLRRLMNLGIDTMLRRIDFQLTGYSGLRSILSTGLDYYIQLSGLDRNLLVGPNDEYLQPGMSAYFPQGIPPTDSLERDLDYWLYDKAIRGLYRLDKHTTDTLQPLQALYQQHRNPAPAGELLEHLQRHVRGLDQQTINGFQDNTPALREWVRKKVSIQLGELFTNPGAGYSQWYNPLRDALDRQPPGPVLAGTASGWSYASSAAADIDVPELLRSLSVTSYDPLLGFELPLKIERQVGGKTYRIFIDNLTFGNAGIQVDAFCILPLPGKDGEFVAFKGENIPLTKGGFQGKQKLSLVSQLDIGLSTFGTLTFPTGSDTYVEFSCDGYEGFSLDGQVLFCRDKLIPVDDNGKLLDAPNRVTADFVLAGTTWPNFLLKLETDKRFAVKDLRDIYWLGQDIWIDFSEDASPSVTFPDGYRHAFVNSNHTPQEQWRGVHISTLDVTVDVLAKRKDGGAMGFRADDLIIDDSGVTVKATGRNLLTEDEGTIGKWKIAVDTVFVHLQQSTFKAARITGDLVLPTDDADKIGYVGQASAGGDYGFSARLEKDKVLSWDMWDGELTLAANTNFEMLRSATSGWDVRARLYGKMKLGIKPTAKFTVPDIVFEDFRLASFSPYVDLGPGGRFGIEGAGVNLGGFGIEVSKLALIKGNPATGGDDQFGVDVAGKISFMGGSGGFGAGAGVTVFGNVNETADGLDFNYDRLRVNDIFLATKIPGVMINGGVRFYDGEDHPAYGNGFQGLIDARFDGVGLGLKAAGQFGSMGDYRYWFVDAAALLQLGVTSIPLVGVVHLTGIGGGASYHMTRSDNNAAGQSVDFTAVSTELPPIGTSITNINYVPDEQTGLGLRLMGAIATFPTASVMNGAIILGAEFSPSWGINKINLDGSAAFMTPPPLPGASTPPAPTIAAGLNIEYLHRNRELNGSLRGYLNYGGTVVGALTDANGKPNYIGQIDFQASPSSWKLWMGTPDRPLSIKLNPLDLTVGTYLDAGTTLPAFPALPAEFSSLGLTDLSVPAGAKGFMHGFDARIPTGPTPKQFTAWRIRAQIRARFGYNMLLTNSLDCQGRDNFGIGGWFLQGNAYAGFYGGLQFGTALEGDKFAETVTLASLNAKAAVQLRGPNPTFFEGAASVDYHVLGWQGSQDMDFAFGETCNLINVPPPAIETDLYLPFQELIAYSQPASGQPAVAVTVEPQLHTVEALGKSILVPQGDNNRYFRINAREADITLRDLTTGQLTDAGITIGERITLNPYGTLTPEHEYELSVRVFLEERVNGNWILFRENGQAYEQLQVIKFTTGGLPDLGLIKEVRPAVGDREIDIFAEPFFRLNLSKLSNMEYFFGRNWTLDIREAALYRDGTAVATGSFQPGTGYYDTNDYTWTSERALEPETDYELRLRVGAKRMRYEEEVFLEVGDERYEETVTVAFRTGRRRDKIPEQHVVAAYPGLLQYNTYRDLRNQSCFLELDAPLTEILGPDWLDPSVNTVKLRYLDNVTRALVAEEEVTLAPDLLEWPALPAALDLDKTYELQFVVTPLNEEASGEEQISVRGTTVNVTPASPPAGVAAGTVIFQYWFRTSAFATFTDKVAGLNLGNPVAAPRQGTNSPRIWDQAVPVPNYTNDSLDYPYVADLSIRQLGTDVYRVSQSPGELFSADELDEEGLHIELTYRDVGYVKVLRDNYFNWRITTTAVTCNGDGTMSSGVPVTWEDLLPTGTLHFKQTSAGPTLTSSSGHGLSGLPAFGVRGLIELGSGGHNPFHSQPDYPSVAAMEADRTRMPGFQLQPFPRVNGRIILSSELSSQATIRYNQSWAFRRSFALQPSGMCGPDDLQPNAVNPNEVEQQLNPGDVAAEVELINNAVLAAEITAQFGGGALGAPVNSGTTGSGPTFTANVAATSGGNLATVTVSEGDGVTQFSQGAINQEANNAYGTQGGDVTTQVNGGSPLPGGGFRLRQEAPAWLRSLPEFREHQDFLYPLPDVRGQSLQALLEYRVPGPRGQTETYYSDPIDLSLTN